MLSLRTRRRREGIYHSRNFALSYLRAINLADALPRRREDGFGVCAHASSSSISYSSSYGMEMKRICAQAFAASLLSMLTRTAIGW